LTQRTHEPTTCAPGARAISALYPSAAASMRDLLVFSCTRSAKDRTRLYRSLGKLGIDRYYFDEDNTAGLSARYNKFFEEHAGGSEIAILAHDDVSIEDVFVREKLSEGAKKFAIQGLAGAATFQLQLEHPQTMWIRAPKDHLSGAVEHVYEDGRTLWSVYGPVPKRCAVLDGAFLAVDLSAIGSLRFDEQFTFHFYDLDFCLEAARHSLSLGTVNVHANHASHGEFTCRDFFDAQERFRTKWQAILGAPSPGPLHPPFP